MDYVLYAYGAAVLLLVAAAVAIARRLTASVAEPVGPSYRVGSPSWRAQQQRAQEAAYAADLAALAEPAAEQTTILPALPEPSADDIAAEVEELERQLARVTAPEMHVTSIVHWESPPTYVHAAMGDTGGAETWGDLLAGMSTEEQTVYNLQMLLDHEEHKEVERGFLSDLDRTVDRVLAKLARDNEAAERRAVYWETAAASRADYVDSPTGAWPALQSV